MQHTPGPSKIVKCLCKSTILGWILKDGQISVSPNKVAVLSTCATPSSVRNLRSFIGAYKMLARDLPGCAEYLASLESFLSGKESREKLVWTDDLISEFCSAQQALNKHRSMTLPRAEYQLRIVTDGSVTKHGIGATLYVNRDSNILLAVFFSAKLKEHQIKWLPCEIEALGIVTAIKHFAPFFIQSKHKTHLLTESTLCVQATQTLLLIFLPAHA